MNSNQTQLIVVKSVKAEDSSMLPGKPDLQFYLIVFYQLFISILRGFVTNCQTHGQNGSEMRTQLQVQTV